MIVKDELIDSETIETDCDHENAIIDCVYGRDNREMYCPDCNKRFYDYGI